MMTTVGRVVSVGGSLTWEIPLTSEVIVQPAITLVKDGTGRVFRLIERDGQVVESPLTTAERWHVMALFGADT